MKQQKKAVKENDFHHTNTAKGTTTSAFIVFLNTFLFIGASYKAL